MHLSIAPNVKSKAKYLRDRFNIIKQVVQRNEHFSAPPVGGQQRDDFMKVSKPSQPDVRHPPGSAAACEAGEVVGPADDARACLLLTEPCSMVVPSGAVDVDQEPAGTAGRPLSHLWVAHAPRGWRVLLGGPGRQG